MSDLICPYIDFLIKNNVNSKQNYFIINDNNYNIISKLTDIKIYKNIFVLFDDKKYYNNLTKRNILINSEDMIMV